MEISGEQIINAPQETIWDALNDPEILQHCIPGCKSLTQTENGGFDAAIQAKVGPVKATFKGSVTLENTTLSENLENKPLNVRAPGYSSVKVSTNPGIFSLFSYARRSRNSAQTFGVTPGTTTTEGISSYNTGTTNTEFTTTS